jgi:hypothetical protein
MFIPKDASISVRFLSVVAIILVTLVIASTFSLFRK